VTNHSTVEAATPRPEDVAAARRLDGHLTRWWLDPVYGRGFPADMRELYGVDLPERAGDPETIAAPLDWHGLNYYFPAVVVDDPDGPVPHAREVHRPEVPRAPKAPRSAPSTSRGPGVRRRADASAPDRPRKARSTARRRGPPPPRVFHGGGGPFGPVRVVSPSRRARGGRG
ncbi:family 1 glycosylhydrolase, partial [Streptomyces sp. MS191]|uniref:family 1 glycosylhydrolase n=1 Tax=Streptomyces sp. ms191 TaxID=1827978 RepID=UPI0021C6BFD0